MKLSERLALLQETGPKQALTLGQPTLGRRPGSRARMPMTKSRPRLRAEARRRFYSETSPKIQAPLSEPETNGNAADEEAIVLKAALVNLNVSVTSRSGMALANLKKEDFEVAENSEPQKIEFFQPTTAPYNLVLAPDLSGSIKDKLDIVKNAALRFVDILGPAGQSCGCNVH